MASEGPNNPTANTDVSSVWNNETAAYGQSGTYANQDIPSKTNSGIIRFTDFDFAIPTDATINGIVVEVDDYGENGNIDDQTVQLCLSGSAIGGSDDKSNDATIGDADTSTYRTYGGSGDGWNAGLTYDEVNDSTFGVQLTYYNGHNTQARYCYIDHVRITVYYTAAGAGGISDKTSIMHSIGVNIGVGIG